MQKAWIILVCVSFMPWCYGFEEVFSVHRMQDIKHQTGFPKPLLFVATLISAGILGGEALSLFARMIKSESRKEFIAPVSVYSSLAVILIASAFLLKKKTDLRFYTFNDINQAFFCGKMMQLVLASWAIGWFGILMYNLLKAKQQSTLSQQTRIGMK